MHTLPTVHRLAVGWPATLGARRLISLSCWLTIISLCLGNLRAAPPAQPDYFSRAWTTANGLPDNKVTAVIQTRDGYLWLGTYGGLVRFDGVRFTVFSSANTPQLASDRVTSLFEDSRGVLWIGHERGDLTACQDLKFTAQTTRVTGVRRKISAIGEDADGDIWMLDEEGTLVRARDGAIRALPNHDGLALMAQAGRRELWVASGGQLATLNHGQLVSLMAPQALLMPSLAMFRGLDRAASAAGGLWRMGPCANGTGRPGQRIAAGFPRRPKSRRSWKWLPVRWPWEQWTMGYSSCYLRRRFCNSAMRKDSHTTGFTVSARIRRAPCGRERVMPAWWRFVPARWPRSIRPMAGRAEPRSP